MGFMVFATIFAAFLLLIIGFFALIETDSFGCLRVLAVVYLLLFVPAWIVFLSYGDFVCGAGYIDCCVHKASAEGLIWKTNEVSVGVNKEGLVTEHLSVTDQQVFDELKQINTLQPVRLYYDLHFSQLPWLGDTCKFVTKVEKLKKEVQ